MENKIKILTWIIVVITALTMLLALLSWNGGTIMILIYTALVMTQSIWLLKSIKKKI